MTVQLDELRDAPRGPRPRFGHEAAELILERVQNTLSNDVAGLLAPQNLAAIVAASAPSRPIVESARHVDLRTGKLTYPKIVTRPAAAKQTAEKTEGGGTKLEADQASVNASTYSAGGDVSWAAITYSDPSTIELWLTLAAQAYAKATEVAAGAALAAGVTVTVAVGGTDLAHYVAAITKAAATIQSTTDYLADTIYCDPTSAATLAGLAYAQAPGATTVAGMRLISSNGLTASAPITIVGYSQALLTGEMPGAPIDLRAVEPAIGGMEIGVIGSFAVAVADPAGFVKLT
jgi:hypothetical protein